MKTTKTYASFIFRGIEVNPDDIEKRLNIKPTRAFNNGDFRKNGKLWPHGYYEISTNVFPSDNINEHLKKVIQIILPKKKEILKIQSEIKTDCFISCFGDTMNEHIGLEIGRETIKTLFELNLELYFDYYLNTSKLVERKIDI